MFVLAGGNWNNGANYGPAYWNLNNGAGNSNRNIGTHPAQSHKALNKHYRPVLKGQIHCHDGHEMLVPLEKASHV